MLARANLESLLRERKLDRTLAVFPGGLAARGPVADALATGHPRTDQALDGGWPRGHLSALSGPLSAGRTTLVIGTLAAATGGGELAALIDAGDGFDPEPAVARGVVLERLLWIRGTLGTLGTIGTPGSTGSIGSIGSSRRPGVARALTQALRAFDLVLRAGGFAFVALDLSGVPARAIAGLPLTTWLRLGRSVEGSRTAALVIADVPVARSGGGVSLELQPAPARWRGQTAAWRLFDGPALAPRLRGFRKATP
jgi:hypothetical protein